MTFWMEVGLCVATAFIRPAASLLLCWMLPLGALGEPDKKNKMKHGYNFEYISEIRHVDAITVSPPRDGPVLPQGWICWQHWNWNQRFFTENIYLLLTIIFSNIFFFLIFWKHIHPLSKKLVMTPLTDQELDAVTIVFHQFETGLREGTIYTKVRTRWHYMTQHNMT